MNYAAVDVKKLREETGATFADCKNALTEANNWDEAIKILEARNITVTLDVTILGEFGCMIHLFLFYHSQICATCFH